MPKVVADPLSLLRTRTSAKWRVYPEDVLPLFVAEMDYPLAPPIREALIAAIDRSDTGYVGERRAVAEAFAGFAEGQWGWRVDPAQVTTTTDVSVVVVEALRASIRPGDGVVIMPPVYPPFVELVEEACGRVVEVPLSTVDGGWAMDLEGIERALVDGARAVLLCNPHNPLGWCPPVEQLAALAELAERHGATVVSDEIHAPLDLDATMVPFLAAGDAARRVGIAACSASKAFNLAGLKCALFVTDDPGMRARVESLPREVAERTGLFGLIATTVGFTDGLPWLEEVRERLRESRALLAELLADRLPAVGYRLPSASYLAWLDFRALGWGEDPAARILADARVALNSGPAFGRPGAGHARLNLACSPEVLTEAVDRIARLA